MSKCGNCKNKTCTCQLNGDGTTTKTLGLGTTYSPLQVRPISPNYRPVGFAARTDYMFFGANTNIPIPFMASDVHVSTAVDMWNSSLPTRLTAPIAGLYLIGGMAGQQNDGSFAQVVQVWIVKNGVVGSPLVKRSMNTGGAGLLNINMDVCTLVRLVATDYIELYIRSNQSDNGPISASPSAYPFLWANWMGP